MAALQSENDMKHFKYISLAPAICESELNLHSLASVSNQTEIFYSRADKILAWLFKLGQKKLENPIGLVGYKKEISIGKLINCTNMAYKKNMGHTDYEENLLRLLIESAIFSEIIKETT